MPKAQDDDQVMTLVELALSQPLDTREAYVRKACAGDTELFSQVWDYVRWNRRMQNFLLEPLFPSLPQHQFAPGSAGGPLPHRPQSGRGRHGNRL